MSSTRAIVLLPLLLLAGACSSPEQHARGGVLDLRNWDPSKGAVRLDGEWLIERGALVSKDGEFESRETAVMPHASFTGQPCATLRLRVLLPPGLERIGIAANGQLSAHAVYVDRAVSASGTPSCEAESAGALPTASFHTVRREAVITMHVSAQNHAMATAGVLSLGEEYAMRAYELKRAGFELAVAAALIIIGVYHTLLSVLRFRMHAHAALAVICILALVHHLNSGLRILPLLTDMPYSVYMRLEAIPMFFLGALYIHFVSATARVELHKYVIAGLYGAGGVLTLAAIFLPLKVSTHAHWLPDVIALLEHAAGLALAVLAVVRRHDGAWFVLAGSLVVVAGLANDVFAYMPGSVHLTAPLLLVFLGLQSFATARQFSSAFESVENLGVKLLDTNSAYTRFMPAEFLSYMNKESILDVQLGDHVQEEMTVLFSDIRSFTALSETMTPAENFEFLNGYLSRVGPVIRGHNGFIDKYIGDGIMALFPGSADDAVRAAIDMQKTIQAYNEERERRKRPAIHIGVGIHTGTLIMGIIGENERMEGTVISDVVNVASRIESLTREYAATIMISGDTLVKLEDALIYQYRLLGRVPVKGKSKPVSIVEILDGRPDLERLMETKPNFEKGLAALMLGRKDEALLWLEQVLAVNPNDGAAKFYLAYLQGKVDPERPIYIPILTAKQT